LNRHFVGGIEIREVEGRRWLTVVEFRRGEDEGLGLPGGCREPSELPVETMRREWAEETGRTARLVDGPVFRCTKSRPDGVGKTFTFFTVESGEGFFYSEWHPDGNKEIRVLLMPVQEVLEDVRLDPVHAEALRAVFE